MSEAKVAERTSGESVYLSHLSTISDSSSNRHPNNGSTGPRQPEYEVINPLIQIIRKVDVCDDNQLIAWFSNSELIGIVNSDNNMVLLRKMIVKMLCYYSHSLDKFYVFESLFHLFPSGQGFDDDDVNEEPLNLQRLSYPLKKLCFDYLSDRELAQIKQTCKSFNIWWEDSNLSLFNKLYEKLQTMNNEQMIECIKKIIKMLKNKNKMNLIKAILRKTLCFYRSEIALNIFESLLLSSPNEKDLDNLNDSITESDLNDDEDDNNEPLTLLQIPKALKIESFTYFEECDLMRIQSVCRCLCVAARDPNSLHYLRLKKDKDYRHPWYSRVKSLHVAMYQRCNASDVNPKWGQSVTSLYWHHFSGHLTLNPTLYFDKLAQCRLGGQGTLFFIKHINYSTLKILKLNYIKLDKDSLHGITQCVNLEHLDIIPSKESSKILFEKDPPNRLRVSPFDKLKHFLTNTQLLSSVWFWILSNTKCRKNISLKQSYMRNPSFFSNPYGKAAVFESINDVELQLDENCQFFIDGLCKMLENSRNLQLKHLKVSVESEKVKLDVLSSSSFKTVSSHFKSSELNIEITDSDFEMREMKSSDVDWFEDVLESNMFGYIRVSVNLQNMEDEIMEFRMRESISADDIDLISESKNIAMRLSKVCNIWNAKLSKFPLQSMELSIFLYCNIADYVEYDPGSFLDLGPDVAEDVYEAVYKEKMKKVCNIWKETMYPAIIETLTATKSTANEIELNTNTNCNELEFLYTK